MSRSEYTGEIDDWWAAIRWRGAVNSAIRGKRGQAMMRELAEAMDAMPEKRLIEGELECHGEYCALGVVGKNRGIELKSIDPHDPYSVSLKFDIAVALAREVVYENDEGDVFGRETPEERWCRMRNWVASNIYTDEK